MGVFKDLTIGVFMTNILEALPLLSAFALAGCAETVPETQAVCKKTGETSFVIYDAHEPDHAIYTVTDARQVNPTFIRGETDDRPGHLFRFDTTEKLCKVHNGMLHVMAFKLR
jgi:hypothetical protein